MKIPTHIVTAGLALALILPAMAQACPVDESVPTAEVNAPSDTSAASETSPDAPALDATSSDGSTGVDLQFVDAAFALDDEVLDDEVLVVFTSFSGFSPSSSDFSGRSTHVTVQFNGKATITE